MLELIPTPGDFPPFAKGDGGFEIDDHPIESLSFSLYPKGEVGKEIGKDEILTRIRPRSG